MVRSAAMASRPSAVIGARFKRGGGRGRGFGEPRQAGGHKPCKQNLPEDSVPLRSRRFRSGAGGSAVRVKASLCGQQTRNPIGYGVAAAQVR
jgi:hypothetical protein